LNKTKTTFLCAFQSLRVAQPKEKEIEEKKSFLNTPRYTKGKVQAQKTALTFLLQKGFILRSLRLRRRVRFCKVRFCKASKCAKRCKRQSRLQRNKGFLISEVSGKG
jgi:hypothetical protein